MSNSPLRLEQFDTVLYNANLNPMGIPEAVTKALSSNLDAVVRYPGDYYDSLKKSIGLYAGCDPNHILLSNGSSDSLRLITLLIAPKKAMLLVPSFSEYERVLSNYGCEITYYRLNEDTDFQFDLADFVSHLDSSIDMIIIGNPNNPTSQIISREDMETLAAVCKELEIFLAIDEMYIEFTEKYSELTSVPLVSDYDNIAVLRSVSKFFAVPGLRLSYTITRNDNCLSLVSTVVSSDNISSLTAIACTEMFKDTKYIKESRSQIYTERNLIFSAMSTRKDIKLFKPYANFMLVRLLREDITAQDVADICRLKGIIIRNCENIHGLSNRYIRFCFMKPEQNDLLVNTILEAL